MAADSNAADLDTLKALYFDSRLASCSYLARLHGGQQDSLRVVGNTLRLHLVPVGEPAEARDEDSLRHAVGGVLLGLAALHAAGFVHRDVRWPNVIRTRDSYVLIDLEHAARADSQQDCRVQGRRLASWPQSAGLLDPANGWYTTESDLCVLAHCLMGAGGGSSVLLSDDGRELRDGLARKRLSAQQALQHKWLAET